VDAASSEPVSEHAVKTRYEEEMIESAGIHILEGDRFEGYNPSAGFGRSRGQ
jgi:3-oxoacyl-ACP reductase-like protein